MKSNRGQLVRRSHSAAAIFLRALFFVAPLLVALSFIEGCAVPIPPSGGPEDSTPPALLFSDPENEAVHVETDAIRFKFSERLDERSIVGSISVFPEFTAPLDIRYRGDEIEIRFPEALRENTTYIVRFDTRFRDAHNVALSQPISIAFATGAKLNTGRIAGKLVDAVTGKPVSGGDIFLYALSGSLAEPQSSEPPSSEPQLAEMPVYRTQSGESGTFDLSNLREQAYFVLALRDQNRNFVLDSSEPFGVIAASVTVLDSTTVQIQNAFALSVVDTLGPKIRQIQSTYVDEVMVRFSEDVIIRDNRSSNWVLADSSTGNVLPIDLTYPGRDSREIIIRSSEMTVSETSSPSQSTLSLSGIGPVADSTGNVMIDSTLYFEAGDLDRSVRISFSGFLPDTLSTRSDDGALVLWSGQSAGVHFSSPLDIDPPAGPELTRNDSLAATWNALVSVSDTSGNPLSAVPSTIDAVRYTINMTDVTEPFRITVTAPAAEGDSTHVETFVSVRPDQMGELIGQIHTPSPDDVAVVELFRLPAPYTFIASSTTNEDGSFRFDNLPGGSSHFVRAFLDLNRDGKWGPGARSPFVAPEPVTWYEISERIRARWETILPDTVRIRRP